MLKKRCVTKSIHAWFDSGIDNFINDYLDKYDVEEIIKTPYHTNNAYINISIIYLEKVIDEEDKKLLKEIIKLDTISINIIQTTFSIGFNRAYSLIKKLEELNILSSKKAGRKILVSQEEAIRLIDSIK